MQSYSTNSECLHMSVTSVEYLHRLFPCEPCCIFLQLLGKVVYDKVRNAVNKEWDKSEVGKLGADSKVCVLYLCETQQLRCLIVEHT